MARVALDATTRRLERLNEILPALQAEFEEGVNNGVIMELQPTHIAWVKEQIAIEGA